MDTCEGEIEHSTTEDRIITFVSSQALRVFVESVLRFGLPVNFQGMVLNPQRKQVKKLRETLNDLYLHLDSAAGLGGGEEIPGDENYRVFPLNKLFAFQDWQDLVRGNIILTCTIKLTLTWWDQSRV